MAMRIALLALIAVARGISGCKTAQDYAGSGPLELSPRIKSFLDDHAWKIEGAVAVAYNGPYAYSYTCPSGIGCQPDGFNPEIIIGECEKKAPRCALYSNGGHVLWKGPISIRGSSSAAMTTKSACTMAIIIENGVVDWEMRERYSKYVDRAKSDGMTPYDCAVLTNQTQNIKGR